MTSLLNNLNKELNLFSKAGDTNLNDILESTDDFIKDLKSLEKDLELAIESEESIDISSVGKVNKWYDKSISSLKSYNSQINKFLKNILTNPQYTIDLDDAYTYPLNIESLPISLNQNLNEEEAALKEVKKENQQELIKAIILHLLKIGQSDIIEDIIDNKDYDFQINSELLQQFKFLNEIVDDITIRHDLTKALAWFKHKYNSNVLKKGVEYEEIEFKLHILKFVLLLNGNNEFSLDNALEAYLYSKENFPRFFKTYLHELSPLMSLLLFKTIDDKESTNPDDYARKHMINLLSEFYNKMKLTFSKDWEDNKSNESRFVQDVLNNFETINENSSIFTNLASEFISYYCKDMKLSNDSSLFQGILAGFINLPPFYKYNKIQRKLSRVSMSFTQEERPNLEDNETLSSETINYNKIIAPFTFDLPFQLSDTNRFLFEYHPVFICPVSKEQLIPLTQEIEEKKTKKPRLEPSRPHNPVVVLKYCHHVALKESIWQLSRRGAEVFKCHYCYKKHKFSEVSEAYFIDL